jgi:electron transfer flavoprotein alpha subunit
MNLTNEYSGVFVIVENNNEKISEISIELLGEGMKLADELNVKLMALFMGEKKFCKELIEYGADIVYFLDLEKDILTNHADEISIEYIFNVIKKYRPEIVLFPANLKYRSIAPRIASKLDTGLTADCTKLYIDKDTKNLVQVRPAYGGSLFAKIICPDFRPQMSTVRLKVMKKAKSDKKRNGEIVCESLRISDNYKIKIIDSFKNKSNSVNIIKADVIVAVGRGIGNKDNLKLVFELAKLLNGAVGATRAIVDMKWIEYSHQIGQTGFTVSPKLYIACGISGASQHLVGMSSAKKIIAINSDKDAPIFSIADVGIVGDVKKIIENIIANDLHTLL